MSDRTSVEVLLAEAAGAVDYPPTPDVVGRVLAQLAALDRAIPRRRRRMGWLAPAAAILAALMLAGALFGAREAIADLFGIGAVDVEIVPMDANVTGRLDLGDPIDPAAAAWTVAELGAPDLVLSDGSSETLVYATRQGLPAADPTGVGLLVTFLPGTVEPLLLKQVDVSATDVVATEVSGAPALWLEGGPHVVLRLGPDGSVAEDQGRLAANTLVYTSGDTTIRIEGAIELEYARRIAESILPAD